MGTAKSQGYVNLSSCIAAAMLLGCGENGTNPDQSPALSNMAKLGDKLYVAYKSPDVLEKFDTVNISFDYNASKVKSIDIRAMLDSEKTWISLGTVIPDNSKKASFAWVPKNDSIIFDYCGRKEAFIRVQDGISNEHIDSDSFLIIGRVPYALFSPKSKETFSIADTIQILYTQNQDLSSNISVGFLVAGEPDFVNIADKNKSEKLSQSLPIKTFLTNFIPLDFTEEARNFADPITIFIADYGSSSLVLKADSIIITR